MQEELFFNNKEQFKQAISNQVFEVLFRNPIIKKMLNELIMTRIQTIENTGNSYSKSEAKQDKRIRMSEKTTTTTTTERSIQLQNSKDKAVQMIERQDDKLRKFEIKFIQEDERIRTLEEKLKAMEVEVQKFNIDELKHLKKRDKPPVINFQSAMLNKFKINEEENEFEIKEFEGRNYQLLGEQSVREHQFNCCILKTHSKSIGIGVIDANHVGDTNSIWDLRKNCVCMRLANGAIYEAGKEKAKIKQLQGMKIQDVRVSLKGSTVYWEINEKKYEYTSEVLGNQKVKWVGFFLMGHKNDKIRVS